VLVTFVINISPSVNIVILLRPDTSTYQDIPKDCNLVGAEFDKDYPANSSRLHITDDVPFWIGATIVFKRNIKSFTNLVYFVCL
jgi:hypothetical protein